MLNYLSENVFILSFCYENVRNLIICDVVLL